MTKRTSTRGLVRLAVSAIGLIAYSRPGLAGVLECEMPLSQCPADIAPEGGDNQVAVEDLMFILETWNENGFPNDRPPADCGPGLFGDCVVDVFDLLQVLADWGPCDPPLGVCCYGDGLYEGGLTEAECTDSSGLAWEEDLYRMPRGEYMDSDIDGIPDMFEIDDCSVSPVNPCYTSTNPFSADTDGDKLPDFVEIFGSVGVDLPAMGADPCHKDVFIECDWVTDDDSTDADKNKHKPNSMQITRVVNAFAAAPVANPDGVMGIKVHFDVGQDPYNGGNYAGKHANLTVDANMDGDFLTIKNDHFDANRHGLFYYCISGHQYNNGSSSGRAEISGDDFLCTWGQITSLGFNSKGSTNHDIVGNTIAHEFGHCLSLLHGGDVNLNFKPNYNSIMNYRYQFVGIDNNNDALGNSVLNYSSGTRIDLDEDNLDESKGVDGMTDIDWDKSGSIDGGTVARNINCCVDDGVLHTEDCDGAGTQDALCTEDNDCGVLKDYNDWANITFAGLSQADIAPRPVIDCILPWFMTGPR